MDTTFFLTIVAKSYEHIQLWFWSTFFSFLIGFGLALALSKIKSSKFSFLVITLASLIQTIPGLALIALVEALFLALRFYLYLPVTGFFPSIVVLTLYGLFPILKNGYLGLNCVPSTSLEVAKAMGMRKRQLFFLVQLPYAIPSIMVGLRMTSVWLFGLVTLTSLIGSGGLGDLILQGLRRFQTETVLGGAIPVTIMALIMDFIFVGIEKWLSPQRKDII